MTKLFKHSWFDEENRIVQVTETTDGVGTLIAHVALDTDVVEIIDTHFVESRSTVSPVDKKQILQMARNWERRQHPYPKNIRWHEDGMKFETLRESHEWAYTVIYNEIGYQYDGYATEDEKIAYSLVYELNRFNTFKGKSVEVFAHEEYKSPSAALVYRVWVLRYPNGEE